MTLLTERTAFHAGALGARHRPSSPYATFARWVAAGRPDPTAPIGGRPAAPDPLDVLDRLVEEVRAARTLIVTAASPVERRRAAVATLRLVDDLLVDARDLWAEDAGQDVVVDDGVEVVLLDGTRIPVTP